MSNDGPSQGDGLSTGARESIRSACARHDFPLAEIQLDGEILKLEPRSLEALPDGQKLESIADALEDDFRYVTFAIPDADSEETT